MMKPAALLPLFVFLLSAVPATAQVSEAKLQAQEAKVRTLLARNKPYKALSLCNARLGAKPDPRFYPLRADANNRTGEHANARKDAEAWLAIHPNDREGIYQLALAELGLGHGDRAVTLLDGLVAQGDNAPSMRYQLALAYQQAGKCGAALGQVEHLVVDSTDVLAAKVHRLRGECAAEQGDTAQAHRELDKAVALTPRDPVVLNSRAFYVHAMNGRHAAAIKDYDRAIKLNPNYSYAFNNRGWSRYRNGDREGALKDINKARSRKVFNPFIYRNLGLIALGSGDTTRACTHFRTALEYGFTEKHGPEVLELMDKACKQATAPVQAPKAPLNAPDKPVIRSNAP